MFRDLPDSPSIFPKSFFPLAPWYGTGTRSDRSSFGRRAAARLRRDRQLAKTGAETPTPHGAPCHLTNHHTMWGYISMKKEMIKIMVNICKGHPFTVAKFVTPTAMWFMNVYDTCTLMIIVHANKKHFMIRGTQQVQGGFQQVICKLVNHFVLRYIDI